MNLSIHLPNDILQHLDQHVKATANSRSAVVREAVVQYLARFRAGNWPDALLAHMDAGVAGDAGDAGDASTEADEPDFDAIRAGMNASMAKHIE